MKPIAKSIKVEVCFRAWRSHPWTKCKFIMTNQTNLSCYNFIAQNWCRPSPTRSRLGSRMRRVRKSRFEPWLGLATWRGKIQVRSLQRSSLIRFKQEQTRRRIWIDLHPHSQFDRQKPCTEYSCEGGRNYEVYMKTEENKRADRC